MNSPFVPVPHPSEARTYADPITGRTIRQLTNHRCHSHHLYFTNSGWYDDNRRLLFGSERMNSNNLYSLDLATGAILQHTTGMGDTLFLEVAVHTARNEAYFWDRNILHGLHLHTGKCREIWTCPEGRRPLNVALSADGTSLYFGSVEDLSHRFAVALAHGYIGFREYWQAHPLCQLYKLPIDGGKLETIWEETNWISHINANPTQPHLLTFCHEGPWAEVDHRLWVLNSRTGKAVAVRPRRDPDERLGHEYWLADGRRLGYHGHNPVGNNWFFGFANHDGTGIETVPLDTPTNHTFSDTGDMVVGDGPSDFDPPSTFHTRGLMRLWVRENGVFGPARVLCRHDCTARIQQLHVHPRFSPDGKKVLYTSDRTTYGQVYEVEIGDWRTLPLLDDVAPTPRV